MHHTRSLPTAAVGLALALTAAACSSSCSTPVDTPRPVSSATKVADTTALSLSDGWVKAGSGMTAAFGTVVNDTDAPITLVAGSSAQAGAVELHTMAMQPDGSMTMTQKEGGFTVPAGGSLELAPGADHIMLLDLPAELTIGDEVTVEMETEDGQALTWTLPVRSFPGAEETYTPEGSTPEMSH